MRILLHGAAVIVGAAVAVAAVTVHRSVVLGLPLGLLLAVSATFVTAWAMRDLLPRLPTSYAVGWLAAFGFALYGRPEGDYVVAGDLRGGLLILSGLGLVVIGVVSMSSRGASPRPDAT